MTIEAIKKVKTKIEDTSNLSVQGTQPPFVLTSPGQTKIRPSTSTVRATKIYASAIKEQASQQQFIKQNYMKTMPYKPPPQTQKNSDLQTVLKIQYSEISSDKNLYSSSDDEVEETGNLFERIQKGMKRQDEKQKK